MLNTEKVITLETKRGAFLLPRAVDYTAILQKSTSHDELHYKINL